MTKKTLSASAFTKIEGLTHEGIEGPELEAAVLRYVACWIYENYPGSGAQHMVLHAFLEAERREAGKK